MRRADDWRRRVLGSTFDGSYEPVADIAAALDVLESDRGFDVPVHVDAASGGFIAPFLEPDLIAQAEREHRQFALVWDFRLERVRSINAAAAAPAPVFISESGCGAVYGDHGPFTVK